LQNAIGELFYRLLSTREAVASSVIDRIYPILELTDNVELYCVVSSYHDATIKTTSYGLFVEALQRRQPR